AVGVGYDLIRRGRAKRVIAGGYGYYNDIAYSGFNILRVTGRDGCHPFDRDRDGMMLGDGFALVLLEALPLADRRNATPLARVIGYSTANEAHHATSPDPSGETGYRVMWDALSRSTDRLAMLDYINAHGTGTEA